MISLLSVSYTHLAREGDVLDLIDELLLCAFLRDDQLAVLAGGLEALRGEGAAINDLLGVLRDVDESARALSLIHI